MNNKSGVLENIQEKILSNPYRVLGVTCDASIRDITRQSSRLKKYLLAEDVPEDFSFGKISELSRTIEDVDQAMQLLSTDEMRLQNALFWFWSHNPITDEPAFEMLKEGNAEGALDIWSKLVFESDTENIKPVTNKNASAFHNWCILKLILLLDNKTPSSRYKELATIISVEMSMLDSSSWQDFKDSIVDETYVISQEELESLFLRLLLDFQDVCKLPWNLGVLEFKAKKDFCSQALVSLRGEIKEEIDKFSDKTMKHAKADLDIYEFLAETPKRFKIASKIVSRDDAQFFITEMTDKVADVALSSAIDFYNHCSSKKLSNDYYKKSKGLLLTIQGMTKNKRILAKIDSNLEILEENEKLTLCHYCHSRKGEPDYNYHKTLFSVPLEVPRCRECYYIHKEMEDEASARETVRVILVVISVIVGLFTMIIGGFICYYLFKFLIFSVFWEPKKYSIVRKDNLDGFPPADHIHKVAMEAFMKALADRAGSR
ncbi:hypothetical protein [Candidatus Proelusimicrobium excrementi]|uniref:hypothetical protein n=1 Tax=Candidatus Proelusimicrobium excrementi TaxID=3416222 RepID=UPI003CADBD91|nr:hypothetical protein [Elusimicrobiaceae bacterium]